jgi:hypothetical protein
MLQDYIFELTREEEKLLESIFFGNGQVTIFKYIKDCLRKIVTKKVMSYSRRNKS